LAVKDKLPLPSLHCESTVPEAFFRWMVKAELARELKVPECKESDDELDRRVDTESGHDRVGQDR
jgi:hypothetical protein